MESCKIQGVPAAERTGNNLAVRINRPFRRGQRSTFEIVKEKNRTEPADLASAIRTGIPVFINGCDIWISFVGTGEAKNLTGGKSENWLPRWSPDGHYLAFLSDRDGSGQAKLWLWDVRKNELKKASDIIVRTDQIEWTRDSSSILISVLPEGMSVKDYAERVQVSTENKKIIVDKLAPHRPYNHKIIL